MPLPADFDIRKHAVPLGRDLKGINLSGRWGNKFVKEVDAPEHLIEPAMSNFLSALNVPHQPVSYAHRNGEHVLHADWIDGKPLQAMDSTTIHHPKVTLDRGLHMILGEWLGKIEDRHAGNYLFHPDHGVVPIDFGASGANGGGWDAAGGGLAQFLRRFKGLKPSTPIPEASIRHAFSVIPHLTRHHAAAMLGFDPDTRKDQAARLMKRLKSLGEAASSGPVPFSHLLEHQ